MKHNVKFADSWQTLAYRDPEAYQLILRNTPKGRQYQQQQRQSYQQRQLRLSRDRQMIDAPRLRLGWDGYEVRHSTSAPVSRYRGPVNPYYNRSISAPGQEAMTGQARWEDLPSTRMMMAANRMPGGDTPDIKKMSPESQQKWDTQAGRSFLAVRQRSDATATRRQQTAQARQMRGDESAAYDEMVKRLTARARERGETPNSSAIAERARRLAPVVARNYRRDEFGQWKSISPQAASKAHEIARGLGKIRPINGQIAAAPEASSQTQTSHAAVVLPEKKAYTIGFSKVASDYGVDPAALIKAAGLLNQYKNIKN